MPKRVYKYPIMVTDMQSISITEGAKVVHVGLDPRGIPCIWALVEVDRPHVSCVIYVTGTGHDVPPSVEHLGTFIEGGYVWHVWQ